MERNFSTGDELRWFHWPCFEARRQGPRDRHEPMTKCGIAAAAIFNSAFWCPFPSGIVFISRTASLLQELYFRSILVKYKRCPLLKLRLLCHLSINNCNVFVSNFDISEILGDLLWHFQDDFWNFGICVNLEKMLTKIPISLLIQFNSIELRYTRMVIQLNKLLF